MIDCKMWIIPTPPPLSLTGVSPPVRVAFHLILSCEGIRTVLQTSEHVLSPCQGLP